MTALQGAFHADRQAVEEQGVRYAGPTIQPVTPILAVTGRASPVTGRPPSRRSWQALVDEVAGAREDRVVISSDLFADARSDAIRTVVDDLGADRVHVVVTPSPLATTFPDQWQRFVQAGLRASFDDWLRKMLDAADEDPAPTFWHRHRHDRLVARWAEVVGPGNVTVVAPDDDGGDALPRAFERLVGLRGGTLVADVAVEQRAMTWPEVEVVRAFNELFWQEGLGPSLHADVMRYGTAPFLKEREPSADEPRIRLPGWATDRTLAIAREVVDAIATSGVHVVGDLDRLASTPEPEPAGGPDPEITPDIAATAAIGVVLSSGLVKGGAGRIPLTSDTPEESVRDPDPFIPRPTIEPLALVRLSTPQILGVLVRRAGTAVTRRLPFVGRPPG